MLDEGRNEAIPAQPYTQLKRNGSMPMHCVATKKQKHTFITALAQRCTSKPWWHIAIGKNAAERAVIAGTHSPTSNTMFQARDPPAA